MKRISIHEFWHVNAPAWQAKLDGGGSLTDEQQRHLVECMEAWSNEGLALAKKWTSKELSRFKRSWERSLRHWESKEGLGNPFSLEERKEQQIGLGVWWWMGYMESSKWDKPVWNKFPEEADSFSKTEGSLLKSISRSEKHQRISAGSNQRWDQIGLDYLNLPIRHRQRGEYNQGVWRRSGEIHRAEFEAQQARREAWAAAQIVSWKDRGLEKNDYNFSWSPQASPSAKDGHMALRLGMLYEYAREGRKLRGLLLLLDPARKREPWEINHRDSFEGLDEQQARSGLYEMIDVLAFLAVPLAANLPYAEVLRDQRSLVDRALAHGRHLYQMRLKNGISTYWKLSVPVELARKQELAEATTFDTLAWGGESPRMTDGHPALPSRQVKDGTEVIAFRVDWANYRDDHLKERFGELLKWLRVTKSGMETGSDSIPTEPKPNKIGKKALVLDKALTCLRAARVLHHCHGKSPDVAWQMLGLSQGAFDKETSNFYRDAANARRDFEKSFPFEDVPAHHKTPRRSRRKV